MSEKKIRIQWLEDEWECDTCGWQYALGAEVFLDDQQILLLKPSAYCYGSEFNWAEADVYRLILERLGYLVQED